MARIPGNDQFQKRVEFSDIFAHYLGRRWFMVTQVKRANGEIVRRVTCRCHVSFAGMAAAPATKREPTGNPLFSNSWLDTLTI